MESPAIPDNKEIVHQTPIVQQRLGTNPGMSWNQIFLPDFGDQTLQTPYECGFATRPQNFLPAGPGMFAGELPKSLEHQNVGDIRQIDVAFAVPFSF